MQEKDRETNHKTHKKQAPTDKKTKKERNPNENNAEAKERRESKPYTRKR